MWPSGNSRAIPQHLDSRLGMEQFQPLMHWKLLSLARKLAMGFVFILGMATALAHILLEF